MWYGLRWFISDNEDPVIKNCPIDMNVTTDKGVATGTATWTDPTANDNSGSVTFNQTEGLASGSAFPIGSTTITYTATDEASNSETCTFEVNVSGIMVDS